MPTYSNNSVNRCDATQIIAEKREAAWTYHGERGYMLMVLHLAEARIVIHDDFRAENVAPTTENLDFVQDCGACLPQGQRITTLSGGFGPLSGKNYSTTVNGRAIPFAIGGCLDDKRAIRRSLLLEIRRTRYRSNEQGSIVTS